MRSLYLDTNIIGLLKDKSLKNDEIIERIKSNFLVFVSHTHIKEISNAPEQYQKLQLELLINLNANYIVQTVDNKQNRPIDEFRIQNTPLEDLLNSERYNFSNRMSDHFNASITEILHHHHGGAPDATPEDIAAKEFGYFLKFSDESRDEILRMLDETEDDEELNLIQSTMNISIEELKILINQNFDKMLMDFLDVLSRSIIERKKTPPEVFSNSIKAFRDEISFEKLQLSQIQPPDIIRKICRKLQNFDIYKGQSCDFIFGISENFLHPGTPLLSTEKIQFVYSQLNTIGYHKDKRLKRKERIQAHIYDVEHLVSASPFDILCTNDMDFRMKAIATYEYLGIRTKPLTFEELLNTIL